MERFELKLHIQTKYAVFLGPPVSEEEEEEEAELTFPDTTIQLHHVAGEK